MDCHWRLAGLQGPRARVGCAVAVFVEVGRAIVPSRRETRCRCRVPWKLPANHAAIDSSLRAAQAFFEAVVVELEAIIASVGVNRGMREIMSNVQVCLDWSFLDHARPKN